MNAFHLKSQLHVFFFSDGQTSLSGMCLNRSACPPPYPQWHIREVISFCGEHTKAQHKIGTCGIELKSDTHFLSQASKVHTAGHDIQFRCFFFFFFGQSQTYYVLVHVAKTNDFECEWNASLK